ncbi:spore coat protein U [Zhengella mangrovi]|uniref:Spore coat protein U n=1 Tax=Zhengella mangrovi TaxID=1982044 RepID=A0A2G1QGD1_9HYPH|nr:spore coat U domain-containing protein [Zhengella mangrovi]PHP64587.1 spore coat protein U [Zhengella mangrovi]
MRMLMMGLACIGISSQLVSPSLSATATGSFTSQIVITSTCAVQTTNTLDFGSQGLLTSNVDVTANFDIQCTAGTAYSIGLNAGTTTGGSTTTRKMTNGSDTIDYEMFSDPGRTTNWGNTAGEVVTGTGTGSTETKTIFGRVPPQTTPGQGTYTDSVTITITY